MRKERKREMPATKMQTSQNHTTFNFLVLRFSADTDTRFALSSGEWTVDGA